MKRALLKQILHEWRTNIWLVIELAVVLLAVWVILSLLWSNYKGLFYPSGFNQENVYLVDVKSYPKRNSHYNDEYKDKFYEDRTELIRRLRENPNVEYVSLHRNGEPYTGNYWGSQFMVEGLPDSILYSGNTRFAEPDYIKVMDIRSKTGKTQEELMKIIERGEVLYSENEDFEEQSGQSVYDLIGKTNNSEYEGTFRVGDIVEKVRNNNFEYDTRGVIISPYDFNQDKYANLILRVKPGRDNNFLEDFEKDPSLSSLRNVYLTDLKSLASMGDSREREFKIDIRLKIGMGCFLIVTIFLGLLGSFWFRVQQRVSEIAIRKTFGATDKDLFRRIIGEGLILLIAGFLLTSACVWPFVKKFMELANVSWGILVATEGIAFGVLAIGIVISLLYPAWRAMEIEPAIAVKEE